MKKHYKKHTRHFSTVLNKAYQYNQYLLDLFCCISIVTVIVILPTYQKFTYASIGSDKRSFFTGFLQLFWKIAIPLLLLHLILFLIRYFKTPGCRIPSGLKQLWHSLSSTDRFVGCYMIVVLISYLTSDYPSVAAIGASGWSMGALMQLSMGGFYFMITRFWKRRSWMFLLLLPISCLLFALGYLNRFNVWPIPMEVRENPQFISLVGNINWYCGYLVTVLFAGVYLLWSEAFSQTWHKRLIWAYVFIGFAGLTTNGSSSGILTLIVIMYFLFILSVSNQHKMTVYCNLLLCLGLSCLFTLGIRILFPDAITYQETTNNLMTYSLLPVLIVLFALTALFVLKHGFRKKPYPVKLLKILTQTVTGIGILCVILFVILIIRNTMNPGSIGTLSDSPIFTFSPEWGSRRGATWTAGVMAWWEQPLLKKIIGVGPDCMGSYLYTDTGPKLLSMLTSVWTREQLTNAHCEWLTVLVNLGLLGLISFAGIIITSVKSFLSFKIDPSKKGKRKTTYHSRDRYLIGACGLAVLAYTVHNVVSFQQIVNEPTMFVILAIGAAYRRSFS